MSEATWEELRAMFREIALAQQETDRKFQETDRKFQETGRQFRDTDRRLKQISTDLGRLGNRLGEFVEELVKPAVVRLFQARGVAVHEVHSDISVDRHQEGIQIDLLVVDDDQAILVEAKSKLAIADVDEHLERLRKFKRMLPRYADVRAMGAVAAMVVPDEVARYAYRHGLFVLAQFGDNVAILNDERFQPHIW